MRNAARYQLDPDSYFSGIADRFDYFDSSAPPPGLPGACTTAAVGGQVVLWTNNCPRPADFERWPALPPSEWDHYLGEAERYLDVHADTFAGSVRQQGIRDRLCAPLAATGRTITAQPMAGRLLPGGAVHYTAAHDMLDGTDVTVRHGDVRRVILDGKHVSGVELSDGTVLGAAVVVVAAGAFGTPVLLHRSGIRPPALGRHLTYHPVLFSQLVLDENCCGSEDSDLPPRLAIRTADHALDM